MSPGQRQARAVLDRLDCVALVGVEVGVYRGEMSEALLRLCPDLTLWMVDDWKPASERPPEYERTRDPRARDSASQQERHMRQAEQVTAFAAGRRHIIRADSVEAAASFGDGSCDFVFIDAAHHYEAVAADIAAWAPKVRGLLCGHDYSPPGVLSKRGWPDVVRAVDEFAVGKNLELGDCATWFVRL